MSALFNNKKRMSFVDNAILIYSALYRIFCKNFGTEIWHTLKHPQRKSAVWIDPIFQLCCQVYSSFSSSFEPKWTRGDQTWWWRIKRVARVGQRRWFLWLFSTGTAVPVGVDILACNANVMTNLGRFGKYLTDEYNENQKFRRTK